MSWRSVGQKILFAIAVAASFLLGYNALVQAGPHGREFGYGYFLNKYQASNGGRVLFNGIYSSNAEQFINDVLRELRGPCNYPAPSQCRQRTGAEFIIHTMISSPISQRSRPPSDAQINDWADRVRYASSRGLVDWDRNVSFNVNSMIQLQHNDATFYQQSGGPDPSIVFFNQSGAAVYVLRKECANPVGESPGLPTVPPDWRFSGDSTVNGTDRGTNGSGTGAVSNRKTIYSLPGDRVGYSHTLRNQGPDTGYTRSIAWERYNNEPVPPNQPVDRYFAPPKTSSPSISNPSPVLEFANGQTRQVNSNGLTIPSTARPGQRFCQYVSYFWAGYDERYEEFADENQACAIITYGYNLNPAVSSSKPNAAQGDTVNFNYNVTNTGITESRSTRWTVQQVVFNPSAPTGGSLAGGDGRDCGYYTSRGASSCGQVYNGSPRVFSGDPDTTSLTSSVPTSVRNVVMNYPAGTRVCQILTVDPPTHNPDNPRNRWSTASCVTISKRPHVHFMGGDISVGRPYQSEVANCSSPQPDGGGSVYTAANASNSGSTAEYAAFVRGIIQFAPAEGHGFGTASRTATTRDLMERLSFANTESEAGRFNDGNCMDDYYAEFSAKIPATSGNATLTLSGDRQSHYTGDVTINASDIANGARIIIVADGKVTINGNIRYSANYPNVDAIPSIAIIARDNLTINDNVNQVDGVYITKSTLNTCNKTPPLSTNICNQQLNLNGIIVTDRINLHRTFGADGPQVSEPAERFNYTTELFFNNILEDEQPGIIETVEQRDLPPRY